MRTGFAIAVIVALTIAGPVRAGEYDQLVGQLQELQGKLSSLQGKLLASNDKGGAGSQSPSRPTEQASADKQSAGQQAAVTALTKQVALLRDQVAKLTAAAAPQGSDSLLLQLMNDLAELKSENLYLRTLLGESEGSLEIASLDGGSAEAKPTLMSQLQQLNSRLDKMINNSPLDNPDAATWPNGLSIGGFVKATNKNDHNLNKTAFKLDEVEVDFRKSVGDRAAVRADIELFSASDGSYSVFVEQGFVSYSIGSARKVTFDLGKFNSPLGLEGVDPTDIKEVTQTKLTSYALPVNVTGFRASSQLNSMAALSLFVVNGWDLDVDNNSDKTVGAQLSLSLNKNVTATVGGIMGPEQEDNVSAKRTIVDASLAMQVMPSLLVAGEWTAGRETKTLLSGQDGEWMAAFGVARLKLSSIFSLNGRIEYFDDVDGLRTGWQQQMTGFSFTPSFKLAGDLKVSLEGRYDQSSILYYLDQDGIPKDTKLSTALGCTYSF